MKRLVVIGAGISGLAAAHAAARSGSEALQILVLEKDSEPGGKARTRRVGPWAVETGPAAYLSGDEELDDLVAGSGLQGEVRIANPSSAERFVVRGGRLRAVSPNPVKLARSGLLGPAGLIRLLGEPFVSRATSEETVWDFAARRLGRQVADRLVGPMVLGVFAGDAKKLSLPAAFPRLAELEREHGSLLRGLMKSRGASSGGAGGPRGILTSFTEGMQQLPRALAAQRERWEVRCDCAVEGVAGGEEGWTIHLRDRPEPIAADALVLAGEAWSMAGLFSGPEESWRRQLREVAYPPVAIVALGLPKQAMHRVPRGLGALIPRSEGFRMLGVLFDGYLFEGRGPEDALLVRAFFGGAVDPSVTELADRDLVTLARSELERLLGLEEEPLFTDIVRWDRAIPQYEIGHPARVRDIDEGVARIPGLFLAGNALHGIAFGKAAAAGVRAGRAAVDYLRPR